MNLYIVRHVSKQQVWYRAKSDFGIVWSSSIDEAEVYGDLDYPAGFEDMKMRVDVVDGKLVLLGVIQNMRIEGSVTL